MKRRDKLDQELPQRGGENMKTEHYGFAWRGLLASPYQGDTGLERPPKRHTKTSNTRDL